ncbi:hypothetical protein SAMD00023353_0700400 [Rosellinia necatrix]|uniref:Uncharacterized protein n=1 Tax=Rosellinia necatrix TaxID=77044 RepID=A0A1S8A6W4_ROSNE|nr:hypothetical protein SAMD00023353_0700400 [Rosellinia necatrix]
MGVRIGLGGAFDPESSWAGDTRSRLTGDCRCWSLAPAGAHSDTDDTRVRNQTKRLIREENNTIQRAAPSEGGTSALVVRPLEPLLANQLADGAGLVQP